MKFTAAPRIGKDHLVLADWPLGAVHFHQRRRADGQRVDYAVYEIERDGKPQRVTLESPSQVGLPTAGDTVVIPGLLTLAKDQRYATDTVHFVPAALLRILRWPANQKGYQRLKRALKRLTAVTITYENCWYSRTTRTVEACLMTGILAEAKLVLRRGGRPSADSYVQWTGTFYRSLQEGSLIDLDLNLLFGLRRPGARELFRHLNKVWYGGRKPKPYARDLKELACAQLGMTDCKDLKRNFHADVKELEERGYLAPSDMSARYEKIRPGVWRAHFQLHQDQLRPCQLGTGRSAHRTPKGKVPSDAATLLTRYHRERFGRDQYKPTNRELAHAKALLSNHEADELLAVIPTVAESVQRAFRDEDHAFGAAVPYFAKAIEKQRAASRAKSQQAASYDAQRQYRETISQRRHERSKRRQALLVAWRELDKETQRRYLKEATDNAPSALDRRRLCRANLATPPLDVLERMNARRVSAAA